MGNILIKNGRVWDGNRFFYADVLAQEGVISRIGENIEGYRCMMTVANGNIVWRA